MSTRACRVRSRISPTMRAAWIVLPSPTSSASRRRDAMPWVTASAGSSWNGSREMRAPQTRAQRRPCRSSLGEDCAGEMAPLGGRTTSACGRCDRSTISTAAETRAGRVRRSGATHLEEHASLRGDRWRCTAQRSPRMRTVSPVASWPLVVTPVQRCRRRSRLVRSDAQRLSGIRLKNLRRATTGRCAETDGWRRVDQRRRRATVAPRCVSVASQNSSTADALECLLDDSALHTLAAAVNQSHFPKAGVMRGGVFIDHRRDVSRGEHMEISACPRSGHACAPRYPAAYVAVTTVLMPPRTEKSPTTVMRRGWQAATRSSRIWLVTAS